MEMLYGLLFLFCGICLIFFGVMIIYSGCQEMVVCTIDSMNVGTLIFFGFLLLIGLIFLIIGIKKTWKNIATKRKGIEKYGIVVDCHEHVNRKSGTNTYYYTLTVIIFNNEGNVGKYKEISVWHYDVGTYLKVKHYKDDINILGRVKLDEIPDSERYRLDASYNDYIKNNN